MALLVVEVRVDLVGDRLVRAARLVLVDHPGPPGVVAHPRHQVTQPGPAVGGELVAGVPQVVKVQPWRADRLDRVRPPWQLVAVAPPDRAA